MKWKNPNKIGWTMMTMDKIYAPNWGKNVLTNRKTNKPFTFTEQSWYLLSMWIHSVGDFDGLFENLFHEDLAFRRRAEANLADKITRGAFQSAEQSVMEQSSCRSGISYNGPKIKRKRTSRVTLREMAIILYEHRAKVLAWNEPKKTAQKKTVGELWHRREYRSMQVSKFGDDKKGLQEAMTKFDNAVKTGDVIVTDLACGGMTITWKEQAEQVAEPVAEPVAEEPATEEVAIVEYDVDNWEDIE